MKDIDLNQLRDRAYKTACEHGFHDKELSNEHLFMLVITELAEAVDADRKGKIPNLKQFECGISYPKNDFRQVYEYCLKGTVAEELADAVIRLLDLAGLRRMNVHIIPMGLMPDCHTFTEHIFYVCRALTDQSFDMEIDGMLFKLSGTISYIFAYCERYDIDILWHIEQKMKYNETRERLHGKAY